MAYINAAKLKALEPSYADLSPSGAPLAGPTPFFGTGAAEGYVQELLTRFEARNPEAAAELAFIANEAKWAVGWKSFGRQVLEQLG